MLNDEMDDFVSKPGIPNAFGLLGGRANEVESDKLLLESGFSPDTIRLLEDKGHVVLSSHSPIGSVQAVAWKDGVYRGAADPRRQNAANVAPAAVDATAK